MNIKCMVVDDEPLAIEILESYIEKIDNLELVKKCNNAIDAFSELQKQQIDLIFLDIQMPKLSGIDFLKTIKNPPKVVFTTAYREYALEGYELDAFDYLLKPISFERFLKVISKLNQVLQSNVPPAMANQSLIMPEISHHEDKSGHIFVNVDKKMVKVCLEDILFIESLKDYVKIRTKNKNLVTHMQISFLEEKLQKHNFIRIHRSFVVNASKIESFTATDIGIDGQEIPIGRNYKNEVLKFLTGSGDL